MKTYTLKLTLFSDATLGRGDGVAGLVDAEVEHDRNGMPYLHGRALKGLLVEECANILFALGEFPPHEQIDLDRWCQAAHVLFGRPGSTEADNAGLHVGDARLPADLCSAVAADLEAQTYTSVDVLDSLTAIRRQTAMDESGVPEPGSLRAMRVVLRETPFEAELHFTSDPTDDALALLAACVMALRRVGTGRNRGRGRVKAYLNDAETTQRYFACFQQEVRP
jgi:CRISPR/Cas system CSM-associated protein Csm3 (group 7 of RAMP superfamily)